MACDPSACPRCGFVTLSSRVDFVYPWTLNCRVSVADYVESLSDEMHEWLLAMYVGESFNLLSVETIERGTIADCPIDFRKIIYRSLAQKASGFFLVHNHPSGDARPSIPDRQLTVRLARVSRELGMPLIEHFVVAGGEMREILGE